jgi:S1-C subfamily serine protease
MNFATALSTTTRFARHCMSRLAAYLVLVTFLPTPIVTAAQTVDTTGGPHPVAPRGPLSVEEQRTVAIFEEARTSVVYITTVDYVRDFWTRNVMRVPRGTGSGFFWDDRGHIVTNLHVIRGSREAQIGLADQRTFRASFVGGSPEHDLAVLRIEVPDAQPAPLPVGTSADLRVGQSVYAIGNPFGLDYTLTTGIVSALDRSIDSDQGGVIEHLIQTDAAINPGNSGGPLIDSAGRLIGINTAIFSPSGAYAGVGFAVPVDTINRVVPSLIAYGRYVRPSIGISASDDIGRRLLGNLDIDGVLVLRVQPGSPAQAVGIQPTNLTRGGSVILGDVIRAIDGVAVSSFGELNDQLEQHEIGDTVTIDLWRAGDNISVAVELTGS